MATTDFDEKVFAALDSAPYAPSLNELASRVAAPAADVLAALQRLVAAHRVWMTADASTRAYYARPVQLL